RLASEERPARAEDRDLRMARRVEALGAKVDALTREDQEPCVLEQRDQAVRQWRDERGEVGSPHQDANQPGARQPHAEQEASDAHRWRHAMTHGSTEPREA